MAQRRMFSKEITNSSDFQMMSPSAQALYFHIGMNADDDGFCEVFTIVRMTESKPDDLRALHERGLVFLVDSKVGIVKDWHTNNDIRSDRYTRSKYLDDSKYGEVYSAIMQDKIKHLSRYQNLPIPLGIGITDGSTTGITQDRLGKDSIGYLVVADAPTEDSPVKRKKKVTPEMQEVFDVFIDNPARLHWRLYESEREAASILHKEFGIETLKKRYEIAKKYRKETLCPKIHTPSQFLEKMAKMEDFLRNV